MDARPNTPSTGRTLVILLHLIALSVQLNEKTPVDPTLNPSPQENLRAAKNRALKRQVTKDFLSRSALGKPSEKVHKAKNKLWSSQLKKESFIGDLSDEENEELIGFVNALKQKPGLDHLVSRIDYALTYATILSFEKIQNLVLQNRLTADKLAISYMFYKRGDRDLMKNVMRNYSCDLMPDFAKNKRISQFRLEHVEQLKDFVGDFAKVYEDWYNQNPELFKYHYAVHEISPFQANEVLVLLEGHKKNIEQFTAKFEAFLQPLKGDILKMLCGVKDLASFFGMLPEFYLVYKEAPSGKFKDQKFYEIAQIMRKWKTKIGETLYRFSVLNFWKNLFKEYLFYAANEPQPKYVFRFQKTLMNFVNKVTYTYRFFENTIEEMKSFKASFESAVRALEKTLPAQFKASSRIVVKRKQKPQRPPFILQSGVGSSAGKPDKNIAL